MENNKSRNYQICKRCIMDTSDPDIEFDIHGICNHCHQFDNEAHKIWHPDEEGQKKLDQIIKDIKVKNKDKAYDCILGLSGGIDSSYLALLLKNYDLRVLAIHVDAGWNSELAVSNIESIVKYCDYDLHTHVVNWDAMRKLQIAYLKSGIANQDVPQDHVFFAILHSEAIKHKCNVFMSGGNVVSEFVFPENWHGDAMDEINLKDIYRKHGDGQKLEGYKTISFWDWKIFFRLRGFRQIRPLNYIDYSINHAISELEKIGWRNYGRKHGESVFTKFFQNYFLPTRFGYDKRKPHYSSRILSGELTREQALELMQEPLYDPEELKEDIDYFCKKLSISKSELDHYINMPLRYYWEYKNWDKRLRIGIFLKNSFDKIFK